MLSIQERLGLLTEPVEGAAWQWACWLRSSIPGIVQSFDAATQTCTVRIAIQEVVLKPPPATSQNPSPGTTQNIPVSVTIDDLENVPIIMMRVPGWSITFPITQGTECLILFSDMCIDGWWQNSGVQSQFDRRRHDLSDAIALFGPWSQPNKLSNYSTTSLQIRSDDQTVMVELTSSSILIKAPEVDIVSPLIKAKSPSGTPNPVVTQAFLTWFETVYMPSVSYVGSPPTPPTTGLLTTVLEAE